MCREYLFVINAGGQREGIRCSNNNRRANHYVRGGLVVSVQVEIASGQDSNDVSRRGEAATTPVYPRISRAILPLFLRPLLGVKTTALYRI